jgi:signal transduction histidine kinase
LVFSGAIGLVPYQTKVRAFLEKDPYHHGMRATPETLTLQPTLALSGLQNNVFSNDLALSSSSRPQLSPSCAEAAGGDDPVELLDLLQFITSSVHDLLNASDFEAGINAWLQTIALRVGAARASFYENTVHVSGQSTLAVLAEWARPELSGSTKQNFAEPFVIDPDGAQEMIAKVGKGHHVEFHVGNTVDPMRDYLIAQGNASVLAMPIMVKGASWGAISFDFLIHQTFTPRYLAILQTAADTLASVINRNQEQASRLAEQKERADENAALAKLLEAVALASRKLIAEAHFEAGVIAYLQIVATALNAARACFYDHRWHDEANRMTVAGLCEWVQPGVENNVVHSFANPYLFDPRGIEPAVDQMTSGKLMVVHTEDTQGLTREILEAQGNATVICVPVFVGGDVKYSIGFDSLTRREIDAQTRRVLEMAADAMSAAVKRWEIEKQLRSADAARIEAQRERAQFAERQGELLAAVVSASELLLKAQSLEEVANEVVAKIGQALSADRCVIGVYLPPDERDPYGYLDVAYEWTHAGIARQSDHPELKLLAGSLYIDFVQPLFRGEPCAVVTDDIESSEARSEQELIGAKSQFQYPIMVDGKFWGNLGVDDCHRPRIWSPTEIDSLRLVTSALASVAKREQLTEARIEAERQRESARRAAQIAVIDERNRIARDIHDTLAQGFTGVIMQSQAAEDALQKQDTPATIHHLHRARHIAQTSLHDARRSVFALRPSVLFDQTLAQALAAQLARMLADSAALGSFEEHGDAGQPSNLVATELLRIAQEATTNVLRHACATQIKIQLRWAADAVKLHIADNGKGFNVNQDHPGFGLVSMRERADRMQAVLMIESDGALGTKVCVAVDPQVGGVFLSSDDAALIGKPE